VVQTKANNKVTPSTDEHPKALSVSQIAQTMETLAAVGIDVQDALLEGWRVCASYVVNHQLSQAEARNAFAQASQMFLLKVNEGVHLSPRLSERWTGEPSYQHQFQEILQRSFGGYVEIQLVDLKEKQGNELTWEIDIMVFSRRYGDDSNGRWRCVVRYNENAYPKYEVIKKSHLHP
jgi:hypothetical protein